MKGMTGIECFNLLLSTCMRPYYHGEKISYQTCSNTYELCTHTIMHLFASFAQNNACALLFWNVERIRYRCFCPSP